MNPLTLFGLFAVAAMVVFYALERRSPWFILAFGGACVLGSVYGFLQGAWPFGVVEVVWAFVAIWRWWGVREAEATARGESLDAGTERTARDVILETIRKKGRAQRRDLLPLVTVSKSTLVRLLDKMETEGLVIQTGERKGAYYTLRSPGP